MAWPTEAGWMAATVAHSRRSRSARRRRASAAGSVVLLALSRHAARFVSLSRITEPAEYRIWRTVGSPPDPGSDPVHATPAALPTTDGPLGSIDYFYAVSYYNGVLDSGLLPIGADGRTWVRVNLDPLVGAIDGPPPDPLDVRLEARPGGVVRVHALWSGARDGTERWVVTYTDDGSTPLGAPFWVPTIQQSFGGASLAVLEADLPASADGSTVRALVQVQSGTGLLSYSPGVEASVVADAAAPSSSLAGAPWPGQSPEVQG